ncbi:MAG: hypothetical protein MRY79_09475, partial [Alphaproteobacteria bacterium]|nr:hypothetical protein [Alphaproteobacteria bacterium]
DMKKRDLMASVAGAAVAGLASGFAAAGSGEVHTHTFKTIDEAPTVVRLATTVAKDKGLSTKGPFTARVTGIVEMGKDLDTGEPFLDKGVEVGGDGWTVSCNVGLSTAELNTGELTSNIGGGAGCSAPVPIAPKR